jgi:hypothetical protein
MANKIDLIQTRRIINRVVDNQAARNIKNYNRNVQTSMGYHGDAKSQKQQANYRKALAFQARKG